MLIPKSKQDICVCFGYLLYLGPNQALFKGHHSVKRNESIIQSINFIFLYKQLLQLLQLLRYKYFKKTCFGALHEVGLCTRWDRLISIASKNDVVTILYKILDMGSRSHLIKFCLKFVGQCFVIILPYCHTLHISLCLIIFKIV